jgi:peroxiredoxin
MLGLLALLGGLEMNWLARAEDPPRSKFNREVAVGDPAPAFEGLLGIDGRRHSLDDYRETPVLVVVFLRNLCPTTHQYEARLRNLAQEFDTDKMRIVAISVSRNPAEGLDRMAVRAKDKMYRWPYLIDESQFTGRQYGATVTPQFFVLDQARKIAYMGAFDDDLKGTAVKRPYVADAVRNLLEGKPIDPVDTLAKGCEIEFAK